jgi:hypothetical protein
MLAVLNFLGDFLINVLEIKNWDFFGSSLLFGFIVILVIGFAIAILSPVFLLFKKEVKNENI